MTAAALREELERFAWNGRPTVADTTCVALADGRTAAVPTYINEFWTSKQRDAHSLHEVSYRACFKPQLPRFFIERLTRPGETVFDPFAGRGTTPLEAALVGRIPAASDINPLSRVLLEPRLDPPAPADVATRLATIDLDTEAVAPDELLTFYHPETLRAIAALRHHLLERERRATLDAVDRWIRMVAVNRLTGHSAGFFSVYTLPPNQATSVHAQKKINRDRQLEPPRRDVPALILRKSRALLTDCDEACRTVLRAANQDARLLTSPADAVQGLPDQSVHLVVTSPPFLDVVRYAADNWLRCWFCGIDADAVPMTIVRRLEDWRLAMTAVFHELHRILRPGGWVAFEVGEVRRGAVRLEETVVPSGIAAGLDPVLILINAQQFTKTANVWGVANNALGTNTNRIVVFQKPT